LGDWNILSARRFQQGNCAFIALAIQVQLPLLPLLAPYSLRLEYKIEVYQTPQSGIS